MKIFAHRGASGEFPENTPLAIKQAMQQGCDGIELDVQYHPSGELILSHDSFLKVAGKPACKLQSLPLAELLTWPVGQGETLCTLTDALTIIDGQYDVNIEIKPTYLEVDAIERVTNAVAKTIINSLNQGTFTLTQFIVSSFNHQIIQQIKQQLPDLKIAALIASCPHDLMAFTDGLALYAVNMSLDCVNQAMVDDAHQRGLLVGVYTVDHTEDIKQCRAWQVDYIFSNFPQKARQLSQN